MQGLILLKALLEEVPPRLEKIPSGEAQKRGPSRWSPKEELGHLLDSASLLAFVRGFTWKHRE
jgi:hypothetical protein